MTERTSDRLHDPDRPRDVPSTTRLPAAPLLALLSARPDTSTSASRFGVSERLAQALYRARRRGWVTPYAADDIAVTLLGLHPACVWGESWWTA